MGVGGVQRIVVTVGVGVQGVGTLQELAVVRPTVVVGVEHVILCIRGVESVKDLPTIPAARTIGIGVKRVGARAELVQVAQLVAVRVRLLVGGIVGSPSNGETGGGYEHERDQKCELSHFLHLLSWFCCY
jgi:hypothetical protein